ncbi:hypothetical protein TVAG_056520 [Trichomonas vaginalis G3]|uniref:Uncharacterized protein n=1 Tax=Trichomonas vaginalis (strain ATCC PRA-98 / G3) TaxID=412133 RepID=A2ECL1_TRIV3|nr:proline-rich extensin signature family [Trichomonas vaginalis G3]EAY09608.1 hypothetical protein TVAG_056520 [Trichomonas vaginalis G3]KAI5502119.1 proline-rich extensin signature family [Trichomonas vaginalis G3]|eukprot:XP_001321831.1 hypothetical protein [Trichomonas vaginalis G3]
MSSNVVFKEGDFIRLNKDKYAKIVSLDPEGRLQFQYLDAYHSGNRDDFTFIPEDEIPKYPEYSCYREYKTVLTETDPYTQAMDNTKMPRPVLNLTLRPKIGDLIYVPKTNSVGVFISIDNKPQIYTINQHHEELNSDDEFQIATDKLICYDVNEKRIIPGDNLLIYSKETFIRATALHPYDGKVFCFSNQGYDWYDSYNIYDFTANSQKYSVGMVKMQNTQEYHVLFVMKSGDVCILTENDRPELLPLSDYGTRWKFVKTMEGTVVANTSAPGQNSPNTNSRQNSNQNYIPPPNSMQNSGPNYNMGPNNPQNQYPNNNRGPNPIFNPNSGPGYMQRNPPNYPPSSGPPHPPMQRMSSAPNPSEPDYPDRRFRDPRDNYNDFGPPMNYNGNSRHSGPPPPQNSYPRPDDSNYPPPPPPGYDRPPPRPDSRYSDYRRSPPPPPPPPPRRDEEFPPRSYSRNDDSPRPPPRYNDYSSSRRYDDDYDDRHHHHHHRSRRSYSDDEEYDYNHDSYRRHERPYDRDYSHPHDRDYSYDRKYSNDREYSSRSKSPPTTSTSSVLSSINFDQPEKKELTKREYIYDIEKKGTAETVFNHEKVYKGVIAAVPYIGKNILINNIENDVIISYQIVDTTFEMPLSNSTNYGPIKLHQIQIIRPSEKGQKAGFFDNKGEWHNGSVVEFNPKSVKIDYLIKIGNGKTKHVSDSVPINRALRTSNYY